MAAAAGIDIAMAAAAGIDIAMAAGVGKEGQLLYTAVFEYEREGQDRT